MDHETCYEETSSMSSSKTYVLVKETVSDGANNTNFADPITELNKTYQTIQVALTPLIPALPARPTNGENKQTDMEDPKLKSYCHIKMDSLLKLRESTKKLLHLIEEIQSKTHTNNVMPDDIPKLTEFLNENSEDDEDDCSIYKRLTRRCHCLNRKEFNDFMIHFNEETKFCTSTLGEIIKNIRILKKFLYMGGRYSSNALTFLNEGLGQGAHNEKVDLIQACSHADLCNVFDDDSMVVVCILWPIKFQNSGDQHSQKLAASMLYKLSQLEEGRRYLTFSTKITNDIKKLLRTKSSQLQDCTLEYLNSTLNLLNPPMARHMNITYYCKAEEGVGNRILHALAQYRLYMTLEEIFTHLDYLHNISEHDNGKRELRQYLPNVLSLFKHLLMEYDNSDMNILITNILNNIVIKQVKESKMCPLQTFIVSDMATEPIKTKCAMIQVPSRKALCKPKLSLMRKAMTVEPTKPISRPKKFGRDIMRSTLDIGKINARVIKAV